jgi:hypothetical protein
MQNVIKLENISNLITSPSSYQCRKTTVNMKVVDLIITCISIIQGKRSKGFKSLEELLQHSTGTQMGSCMV